MPEGTPKHQPQPKLPTEALRAPSPKGSLFEERDLEETLPPPMLLEDKVQILFTLQKNPKVGSRGLLRRVSGEPTEAESGSETSQGETADMTGVEANSTSHSVYHLADCHLESSTSQAAEAEFQRLGLSQQSTAATGQCSPPTHGPCRAPAASPKASSAGLGAAPRYPSARICARWAAHDWRHRQVAIAPSRRTRRWSCVPRLGGRAVRNAMQASAGARKPRAPCRPLQHCRCDDCPTAYAGIKAVRQSSCTQLTLKSLRSSGM